MVDLLVQVDLPPPPISIAVEEESFASEPEPDPIIPLEQEVLSGAVEPTTPAELIEPAVIPDDDVSEPAIPEPSEPEEVVVQHRCVVHRSDRYNDTMTLESDMNTLIKKEFANIGVDILLVVDEKMTVYNIAEHLSRPVDKIIEIVIWCVSRNILWVDCPEVQEPSQKEIIELPLFEGNIDKVKKKHRAIVELCDGKRTLQEIATEIGIPYFEALQSILPYRGKTLRIIRTDKSSRF